VLKRFLVGLLGAVVLSVGLAWFLTDRQTDPTAAFPVDAAFDDGGALPFGPFGGRFSPDGRQLMVLSGDAVSLARKGELTQLNEEGDEVIDAAWLPGGNAVLAAFGPVGSDQMVVFDRAGKSLGNVTMKPAVAIAPNGGMAVDSTGRRAAVTAAERGGLPGQSPTTGIHLVDLATGAVTAASPPNVAVRGPVWLSSKQLLVTTTQGIDPGRTRAAVLDLDTKALQPIGPDDAPSRGLAVLRSGVIVIEVRRGDTVTINALAADTMHSLGTLPAGWAAVDVDPTGSRALVLDTSQSALGSDRLRRFTLEEKK
jgi:hypothetical protein